MKFIHFPSRFCALVLVASTCQILPLSAGELTGWGRNNDDRISGKPDVDDFVSVVSRYDDVLALRADGSITAWGNPSPYPFPSGTGYKAIAAGNYGAYALTSDGQIVSWGEDPSFATSAYPGIPTGSGYKYIVAGADCCFVLNSSGGIEGWGTDEAGLVSTKPTETGFTKIATNASYLRALALASDGSVVMWGNTEELDVAPPEGPGYTDIAAAGWAAFAIAADGSIYGWGYEEEETPLLHVPAGNDFVKIAASDFAAVALRSDGTVAAWGRDYEDLVSDAPTGSGFVDVFGGVEIAWALSGAPVVQPPTTGDNSAAIAALQQAISKLQAAAKKLKKKGKKAKAKKLGKEAKGLQAQLAGLL